MSERKPDTAREWVDPDDAPEWTNEMFDMAEFAIGGRVIRQAKGALTANGMQRIRPPAIDIGAARVPRGLVRVYARMGEGGRAMAKKSTGTKAAKAASDTLNDDRTADKSKTAAASALSQVEKSKKKPKK